MNDIEQLVDMLERAFRRRSWHGANLRGSIRRVTPGEAAWRPRTGRHNIWELVAHCAYWKYAARRRLTGEARGSFAIRGSNWFTRPEQATETAWRSDLALLDDQHRALIDAVRRVRPQALHRRLARSADTAFSLIVGVAAHDVYHAGQIQLLRRLIP